jgi:type I restriction enzyme, S subunit
MTEAPGPDATSEPTLRSRGPGGDAPGDDAPGDDAPGDARMLSPPIADLRKLDALLDAPDSAERARALVLQLATQGRLVRCPRPALTPASPGLCVPFDLPAGWMWRRVDELGELKLGRQRSPENHAGPHMRPYLRVANVFEGRIDTSDVLAMNFDPDEVARFLLRPDDVLLNEGQSYELVGRAAIYRGEVPGACFQNTLIRFRPRDVVLPEFALIVFRAYLRSGRFRREAQQTTNIAHLSLGRLAAIEFPLPPRADQARIVARVDQLMVLCDELARRQCAQREAGARLTTATLGAFARTADPTGPREPQPAALENLAVLVDRPEKVADLRTAIIDAALRGRFATGRPTDGTADELLAQLRRERLAVRGHDVDPVDPIAGPFELPTGWRWARMDALWRSITDGDHQPPPQTVQGIPLLTIGNLRRGTHDFSSTRHVPPSYFESLDPQRVPRRGDLLYTVVGSYGIPVLVTTDRPFCVQRHIAILKPLPTTNAAFLRHAMQSSILYGQARAAATGIAQPTVGLGVLRSFLVPVPPLAEQQRLVVTLASLLALCDALEHRLRDAAARATQLADASLRELSERASTTPPDHTVGALADPLTGGSSPEPAGARAAR